MQEPIQDGGDDDLVGEESRPVGEGLLDDDGRGLQRFAMNR